MREIKFRAWDKKNKCWFKEDGAATIYDIHIYPNGDIYTDESERPRNDEYEICLYTGLHDKNGVEIYEGDIIKNCYNSHIFILRYGKYNECDYEYYPSHIGFYLQLIENKKETYDLWGEMDSYTNNVLEVIGNIYENPEMIE
jgi:uncharacterized phage protein (TIGR01671 family)